MPVVRNSFRAFIPALLSATDAFVLPSLHEGLPLARFDRKTLYTPGEAGYSDYPAYGEAARQG